MKIKYKLIDICKIPSNQSISEYIKDLPSNTKEMIIDISFLKWLKLKLITIFNKIKKLCTEVK